jgi:hypothetical protein
LLKDPFYKKYENTSDFDQIVNDISLEIVSLGKNFNDLGTEA